jgi:hypothetical protein
MVTAGVEIAANLVRRPYNGAALTSPDIEAPPSGPPAAASPHGAGAGVEHWLRQLFPRHHLQDEFTHIGTIAAFLMALIGFVVGFFYSYSWLGVNFLLGSIALLLFLILRESTLSHVRVRDAGSAPKTTVGSRYHAGRRPTGPAEAANADSSPPATR